jgi:hypothetical protein
LAFADDRRTAFAALARVKASCRWYEPIEIAVPSLTSLAAALLVIAERVGITKAEAETLVRQPRAITSADKHR